MDPTSSTTRPSPTRRRRRVLYLLAFAFTAVGTLAAVAGVTARIRLARYPHQLESTNLSERRKAVAQISRDRERRAVPALIAMLEKEQDRDTVGMAGNALLRTRDPQGVDVLRRRAETGPDDIVRADLMLAAARLSNRDTRLLEWFQEGASSGESWRALGSSLGMLELGRPEGGLAALNLLRSAKPALRAWGLNVLARTANPVCQAIGQPMPWLAAHPNRLPPHNSSSLPLSGTSG